MHSGRLPLGPLRQTVRNRQLIYTVDRPVEGNSRWGEETDTYLSPKPQPELYLFDETEMSLQYLNGEQLEGSLRGLCFPTADIKVDDKLNYGTARFEVETKVGIPNEDNPHLTNLSLKRVYDDSTEPESASE